MDYAKLLGKDVVEEIHTLFTEPIDHAQFSSNLAKASEPLWRTNPAPVPGIDRIFRYGTHLLGEAVEYKDDGTEISPSIRESDSPDGSAVESDDEEDITVQNVPKEVPTPAPEMERRESQKSNGTIYETHDLGESDPQKAKESDIDANDLRVESLALQRRQSVVSISDDAIESIPLGELDIAARNKVVAQIASVLRLWFANLWEASKKNNLDAVGIVFDLPGTKGRLTEKHLTELLLRIRWFMDAVLELPKSHTGYLSSFKELFLLLHEILRGLYKAIALERENPGSRGFLIVKSVLHSFFKVDFPKTLDNVSEHTWKSTEFVESPDASQDDIRLSYETLMHLYILQGSLASSPVNLLLLNKISLSLDITTINTSSPNAYTNYLGELDFREPEVYARYSSRIIPVLAANFNYFYGLSDDLLSHTLNHSSFFSWITGHKLSGTGYMSVNTVEEVTNFDTNCIHLSSVKDQKQDPLLSEILRFECTARLKAIGIIDRDDERALRAPGFLNVTLLLYSLTHNPTFMNLLVNQHEDTPESVSLLRLWLCVSSYVLHHQVRSKINDFGARLSLLIILKMVSRKPKLISSLRTLTIDEFKWKLCHHRSPVVPNDLGSNSNKNILLYIIDVAQIVLRFNLSKKLDLDNCKIALTIIYHILLEFEKCPLESLGGYRWVELYRTLILFIKFVAKNFNEEDVKYVIEEVFSVFDLILGPRFDSVFEIPEDSWVFGSHAAKSVKYDLLFTMLQYLPVLLKLFERFIPKKDNFSRVEMYMSRLVQEFDMSETKERDLYEVNAKIDKITSELAKASEKDSKPLLTTVKPDSFNYADTFKYLDVYQDYIDFDKQVEILDIFAVLYDFTWVSRRLKRS